VRCLRRQIESEIRDDGLKKKGMKAVGCARRSSEREELQKEGQKATERDSITYSRSDEGSAGRPTRGPGRAREWKEFRSEPEEEPRKLLGARVPAQRYSGSCTLEGNFRGGGGSSDRR